MKRGSSSHSSRNSENNMFIELDPDGKVLSWNPIAEKLFGYSTHEVLGKNIRLILGSQKDQNYLSASNVATPMMIDHSQVITYKQTPDGIFTFVSPSFQSLLGHPVSEVEGQSYRKFVHPEDEQSYSGWLELLKMTGSRLEDFLYRFRHADGTWHWYSTAASPVMDESKRITGFTGIARDITRQKEEEIETKRAKQMLESIFNEIADVAWSLSLPDRKVNFITPSAEKLFETSIDHLLYDPKWWEKSIHPEDKKLIPMTYRLLKKQGYYAFHHRIITPKGKTKWVYNEGRLIKDSNDEVVRLDGLFLDRTDQYTAEENLRYENSLQKILIDISSTYINIELEEVEQTIQKSLQEMGYFVGADRAYIFDYDFTDNTTSNTYEWCAPGIQPEIDNLQKVPLEFIPQWVTRHAIGEEFYVYDVFALPDEGEGCLRRILEPQGIKSLITFPMISNSELMGFVGFDSVRKHHQYSDKEKKVLVLFAQMLINIRNRQKWEREITRQEEKFRNIITNINLGLIEVNSENVILFANQSFCTMSGYALNELKGKNVADLNIYDNHKDVLRDDSGKERKGPFTTKEICIINKQGKKKWWFVSSAPNFNDKGQRTGTIGIHLDITSQKELEQELAKAKNSAEKASKAKELFLANMSHEIRTPLNVIIGMIRILAKENLTDSQQHYVFQSGQAAQHLLTILNNILDMTKIEAGELILDNRDFSLSALVANVKSMLFSQTTEKNLDFKLEMPSSLAPVLIGDEMRLKQVLINLLGNAIKFTDKGCVCLILTVLETTDTHQKIGFEVKDSGIGMPEWFILKIFDKFSQEQSSANRKYEGTGLGMAITRDLVLLMGGDLIVKSKKGSGTVITFSLNFLFGNPEKINEKNISMKRDVLAGYHILVVEDNQMNRFIARQSLIFAGCSVTEACDGKEAIKILEKEKVDLILMDIQMPELDGVAATKHLRKVLRLKTPIIALTANAFKHDIDMYLANGLDDFIIKPYDEQLFLKKIVDNLNKMNTGKASRVIRQDLPRDEKTDKPSSTPVRAGYDLKLIQEMSHGHTSFVMEMLNIFVSLVRECVADFKTAYDNGNMEAIRAIAHKLKPSIDHMGIIDLKEKIRQLEREAMNADPETDVQQLMNEINRYLLMVAATIEKNELQ